jgi:hypothetical protein
MHMCNLCDWYCFCGQVIQPGCGTIVTLDGIDTRIAPSPSTAACGGAVSGAAYWLAFYPADTVKSTVQTASAHSGATKYKLWAMMLDIFRQRGACECVESFVRPELSSRFPVSICCVSVTHACV